MRNKYTKTLMIIAIVASSLTLIITALELMAFSKIMILGSNNYDVYRFTGSGAMYSRDRTIVVLLFSALSLGISISGLVFYRNIEVRSYQLWFFLAALISLSMSFGMLTLALNQGIEGFKNIDLINSITASSPSQMNSYNSISPGMVAVKPYFLVVAYIFPIKAFLSAFVGVFLIISFIFTIREYGYNATELRSEVSRTKGAPTSSRKLEKSLEMVIKAKELLDSGVLSEKDFNEIKARELKL